MRVRKAALVIPFVLSIIACSAAQAQTSPPTTRITIGAKVWHAAWLSYVPAQYTGVSPNGSPAIGESINGVEGKERTSALPQLAISHGNFFGSVSHGRFTSDFHTTTSPIILPSGQNLITSRTDHFKRRESDLNIGYSITPELGIVLGYKDATEIRETSLGIAPQRAPQLRADVKGYLIGATGSFAVSDKLRFYFQAGYGPARLKLRFADPAIGSARADGKYTIGELGLSYPFFISTDGSRSATAAFGYRTQTVKSDSYPDIFQGTRELRDVRDGVVLSLNFTL